MPSGPFKRLIPLLRESLAHADDAALSDAHLLDRFISGGDAQALETLLRRHGPMVWGVCRGLLADHHDAEDAFQATFLVLVRKAASIRPREMVGNWLYGVGRQTALKARALAARRKLREKQQFDMPEPTVASTDRRHDGQDLLDEELSRLPDRYRTVIVLCDLEDRTRKEVAAHLALPEGTVASRLARARELLKKRLARRGMPIGGAALAALLAERTALASLPVLLFGSTLQIALLSAAGSAAGGLASAQVAALTQGVMKTMLLSKLKFAAVLLFVTVAAGAGTGGILFSIGAAQPTDGRPSIEQSAQAPAGSADTIPLKNPRAVNPPKNLDATLPPVPAAGSELSPPPLPSEPAGNFLAIPPPDIGPPTPEQLRARYLKLHQELANHLSAVRVRQEIEALEKELAAARELEARTNREKKAADELDTALKALGKVASAYPDTEGGRKARAALMATRASDPPPSNTQANDSFAYPPLPDETRSLGTKTPSSK